MRRWQLRLTCIAVAALAGLGCNRSFTSGGTNPLGVPCDDAAQCASGVCGDGVCCAMTCNANELCNAPGSRGLCTPRGNGLACSTDDACDSNHCADGVCCDAACKGPCMTCVLDGGAGTCQPAADDTDPRHDCTDACSACYSGSCGAALAGTDPHGACGEGLVCGADRQCEGANGSACDATDGDAACALGSCIGWRCLEDDYEHIDGYPFLPVDIHRTPLGVSVSPQGAAAVYVLTDDGVEQGDETGNAVAVVAPSITGPWSEVGLTFNDYQRQFGAVTMLGKVGYFAQSYASDIVSGDSSYGGVTIYGVTSDGRSLGSEQLDIDSALTQVTIAADQGGLLVGELTTDGELREIARAPVANWSTPVSVEHQVDAIASTTANGRAVIFYLSQGALHAHYPDGTDATAPRDFTPCTAGSTVAVSAATSGPDAGEVVSFAVSCPDGTTLGSFDPLVLGSPGWTFTDAPTQVPSDGLADDGDLWPVDILVPCGGTDGNLLFANLYPGALATPADFEADLGGYTSLMWLQPDGGLAYAGASNPDTQYGYVSMAAGGGPDGTVLLAFDTAPLADGGVTADGGAIFATGPSSLLLEHVHL